MLDLHWTTGPDPKEDLVLEELRLKKEERSCLFTAVNPLSNSMHTFRVEEVKPRSSLTHCEGKGAQLKFLVRFLQFAKDKLLVFQHFVCEGSTVNDTVTTLTA